jgi:RHS repeat-associated protein
VAERYVYDAYGKVTILDSSWNSQVSTINKNEILFAGYRQDPETQLYLARNRAYHPTLGRWLQRDPIGYDDSMNLYEYASSSSLNGVDPSGLVITHEMTEPRHTPWAYDTDIPPDKTMFKNLTNGKYGVTFVTIYDVSCKCNNQCILDCTVTLRMFILLNQKFITVDPKTGKAHDPKNALGHEQDHVQQMNAAVLLGTTKNYTDNWAKAWGNLQSCNSQIKNAQTAIKEAGRLSAWAHVGHAAPPGGEPTIDPNTKKPITQLPNVPYPLPSDIDSTTMQGDDTNFAGTQDPPGPRTGPSSYDGSMPHP